MIDKKLEYRIRIFRAKTEYARRKIDRLVRGQKRNKRA